MNKIQILGYMVQNPLAVKTKNGNQACKFSVAVPRRFAKNNEADFFNCVAYGINATQIAKFFYKGRMIGVTGHINTTMAKEGKARFFYYDLIVEEWHAINDRCAKPLDGDYLEEDLTIALLREANT